MSSSKMRFACIAVLIIIMLACSYVPGQDTAPRHLDPAAVLSVSAEPQPTLVHVNVAYRQGPARTVTLTCTYPGENGGNLEYTYTDNQEVTADYDAERHQSFEFVVKKPGRYLVTCQIGNTEAVDTFEIADSPNPIEKTPIERPITSTNPIANSVSEGAPAATLGPFSSGRMWMELAQATSRGPNFHMLQGCLPGLQVSDTETWHYGDTNFKVAPDGTLTGECMVTGTGSDGTLKVTSKLTEGHWTTDGQVTFRLETGVEAVFKDGQAHNELVFTGAGKFISPTQASGTATWRATCEGTTYLCGGDADDGGTVPWLIDFYP